MRNAQHKWTAPGLLLLAAITCGWSTGCGGESADVRTYREVRVQPEVPPPPPSPHGSPMSSVPATLPPDPARATPLQWETPASWAEQPGTGMRLVSFTMSQGGQEGLCTVITLSGPAGGLQANVARWMGQLDLPVPDGAAFKEFLESQQRFETADDQAAIVVDLLPLTREVGKRDDSMIVGVVMLGPKTTFLKLSGPVALLEKEKENLVALTQSLRRTAP